MRVCFSKSNFNVPLRLNIEIIDMSLTFFTVFRRSVPKKLFARHMPAVMIVQSCSTNNIDLCMGPNKTSSYTRDSKVAGEIIDVVELKKTPYT